MPDTTWLPTEGPTMPAYMKELAEQKAAEQAEYWNRRYDEFFMSDTLRDWVVGVMNNGNRWGLPVSPPVIVGRAEKFKFGWQPVMENTGPKYGRDDILILLDMEYQKQTGKTVSLWDMASADVLALCGITSPDTPGDFGKAVGPHIPGAYWLSAKAAANPPAPGTRITVDGITYEFVQNWTLPYWKPVA